MGSSAVAVTSPGHYAPAVRPAPAPRPALRLVPTAADLEKRFETEALPHLRLLFGSAYRMTRNASDAEDLVQETMLRAFKGFAAYEPGTNVRAWLYTILSRVRTDALRKSGRSPKTVVLDHDPTPVPPPQRWAALGAEELSRAVAALPEHFRVAVTLRDIQDLSYEEIARAEGIPIGTVMSRIHRGRALLREALSPLRGAVK